MMTTGQKWRLANITSSPFSKVNKQNKTIYNKKMFRVSESIQYMMHVHKFSLSGALTLLLDLCRRGTEAQSPAGLRDRDSESLFVSHSKWSVI